MLDEMFSPSAFALPLLLGACAGHVALMIMSHNQCYGNFHNRTVNKIARMTSALVLLGGVVAFVGLYGGGLSPGTEIGLVPLARTFLCAYALVCAVVGYGVLPVHLLRRWLRKPPAALLSNHTHTLDVAAELGYKPVGDGKHRFAARLPWNEVFQVDFAERTFHLPQLPAAWDGLSILHLSDLHLCGTPDRAFFRRVMDACTAWEPDLVALTGDIVDSDRHIRWIVPLLGRLRWRIAAFAILGNHDSWYDFPLIRRRLRRIGMHVLDNRWEKIEVRGEPMVVVGHEGPWFRPAPDLSDCPENTFRLCLSHTPDNIPWARRNNIDLMLSGHNHGGQIRFPVIGSLLVPSRYGRRYDCGIFHEPPTLLHVSRGLGGEHPLRFNCRPEVAKIVLRRS